MNVAAPPLEAGPESAVIGLIPVLIFLLLGIFFAIFPGRVAAFQIWMLERQLRGARKPSRVILYRLLGVFFILFSVGFLVLFVTQMSVPRS